MENANRKVFNLSRAAFWELYSGKREVLGLALINHDPYDQFAWVQGWRFALCDYLTYELGEYVPEFRSYAPDTESYEFQELRESNIDTETAWYALRILDRYRLWVGIAGLDY